MSVYTEQRGTTINSLKRMKQTGEKIACLTAYDASFAAVLETAGVDVILVGDSLGMVIQGHETTVPVTVDEVVYHARAVARGSRRAFRIVDMPFMSYAEPPRRSLTQHASCRRAARTWLNWRAVKPRLRLCAG